jgi:hypothetical protein
VNLESALRAYLIAVLNAQVGSRVYLMALPQKVTLPALTYQRISSPVVQHRDDSDFAKVRMQIDGWADDYAGTEVLYNATRIAMKTFKRASDPRVDKALFHDMRPLYDPDIKRWRASMDYMIFVDEG